MCILGTLTHSVSSTTCIKFNKLLMQAVRTWGCWHLQHRNLAREGCHWRWRQRKIEQEGPESGGNDQGPLLVQEVLNGLGRATNKGT